MNSREYQKLAARTESPADFVLGRLENMGEYDVRLWHALIGMSSEVGELMDQFKRFMFYRQPLDECNVIEELGDVLWYIALACNTLEISMEDVMRKNIKKLRERYPEKYSDHDAAEENRDRENERNALED